MEFFCALNQADAKMQAIELMNASEACFSLQTHLDLVDKRLQGLQQIVPVDPEDNAAKQYIETLYNYHLNYAQLTRYTGSYNEI